MCGGTEYRRDPATRYTGLSPRVRGNRPQHHGLHPEVGSIPACAREPLSGRGNTERRGVYPRVCGGTTAGGLLPSQTAGLSPRVRGNPSAVSLFAVADGSIPACAGETGKTGHVTAWETVYPRVCGGNSVLFDKDERTSGLSPRVRGNLPLVIRSNNTGRSIPACAGEPLGPILEVFQSSPNP